MRTASVTDRERREMLTALLRGVSRSFYLTMRALPGPVRGQIGLAYLLARTADTIADTATLPPDERLARLLAFRAQVQGAEGSWTVPEAEDPAERRLLEAAPRALALLDQTAEADRARIRSVVITLSEGMEMDLRTFPAVESGEIGALADRAALDRYIYLVAGCVGEFWTEMTMAHDRALRHWDAEASAAAGVRFGKALQLTNVLRDTPATCERVGATCPRMNSPPWDSLRRTYCGRRGRSGRGPSRPRWSGWHWNTMPQRSPTSSQSPGARCVCGWRRCGRRSSAYARWRRWPATPAGSTQHVQRRSPGAPSTGSWRGRSSWRHRTGRFTDGCADCGGTSSAPSRRGGHDGALTPSEGVDMLAASQPQD